MKNSVKSILKRSITAALAALLAIMSFAIAGCSNSEDDLDYVKKNGKLVIGITEYPPMDYQESGSDEWVVFDADMAKAFAESLGVKAEFVVIDWGTKIAALKGKTIDCVWNGMTLNDEVAAGMGVSKEYCKNAQVVILPADKVNDYQTLDSLKGLKIAVEGGSEGEKQAKALGCETVAVSDQTKAVMEVAAKTADAAVVDLLLAGNLVGEGTSYSGLSIGIKLNELEYFVVGFRQNSSLVEKFNEFWKKVSADGTLDAAAEKYGVQEAVIKS